MKDADALLAEAEEAFSRISRVTSDGGPDKAMIAKGATQAATICASSELASSNALGLVKGFCSLHVVGLKAVASVIDTESDKIRQGKPDHDGGGGRAVQLLRVLIAALNSFLGSARNNTHGTREDVELLDGTVAVVRRTIDNLAGELNDPKAGMAAARLRGLTAMVCFDRLRHSPGVQPKDASWTENLVRMGTRDVDKLLKCISRQSKKDRGSLYLRNPGSCLEALAALRRVATAVPEVYPKVAKAFADAVKCLGGGSEREWGNRSSLRDETVRHTLVACSSHLADRVGRAPKDARLEAYNILSTALRERPDIRAGGHVSGKPPASRSAEVRSLLENALSDQNPGRGADARAVRMVETVHRARAGTGLGGGTPSERSMAPPERAQTPAAFAAVPASAVEPRERSARSCDEAPSKMTTPAATPAMAAARVGEDSKEPRVTGTLKTSRSPPEIAEKRQPQAPDDVAAVTSPQKLLAPAKAATTPKLSPATARPSKDCGRSGRAVKASTPCERSPRQHLPPALTIAPTTTVEDLRAEQRAAESPAPSKRKGPPLKTKLHGDSPDWREGERYEVLLGESFYCEADGSGNSGGKNDGRVHYAHLKYDFIPGRTNLDAPAALRQGPFAGAGVQADIDGQRWAAEMVYESRDPENPRPVRFSGDAARAQDVECVLVFDGNMFVMEKFSVVGGLKNAQEFSGPVVRSAGGATLEVSMARRRRKEARAKNGSRDKDNQQKQRRTKPQEQQTKQQQPNNKKVKAGGGQAADGSSAPGEEGEKTGSIHRASASINSNAANTGVSVNPANRLSQTKRRKKGNDPSTLETSSALNSGS